MAEHAHQHIAQWVDDHTDRHARYNAQDQTGAGTAANTLHAGRADILPDVGGDSAGHALDGEKHEGVDLIGTVESGGKGRAIAVHERLHRHNTDCKQRLLNAGGNSQLNRFLK